MIPRPTELTPLPISGAEFALHSCVLLALIVLGVLSARRLLIDRGVWPWY